MTPTILIAGIGNIFLGDDGFGSEVARRLAARSWPTGVRVVDYGIRGFDVAFALMDGDDVVYIARNGSSRAMNTGIVLGSRVQAQVTAAGQLMLAMRDPDWLANWLAHHELKAYTSYTINSKERLRTELARIRQRGWAVSEQQLELTYRGVAVPLIDRHGDLVGALNVTMPMGHESTEDAVSRVLPVLLETARALRNLI